MLEPRTYDPEAHTPPPTDLQDRSGLFFGCGLTRVQRHPCRWIRLHFMDHNTYGVI